MDFDECRVCVSCMKLTPEERRRLRKRRKCEICLDIREDVFFKDPKNCRICVRCQYASPAVHEQFLRQVYPENFGDIPEMYCGDPIENALLKMENSFDKKNYEVVFTALTADQCELLKRLKSRDRTQKITFGGDFNRTQTTLYRSWDDKYNADYIPKCLLDLLERFKKYHPATEYFTVKRLESLPGCKQQAFHADDVEFCRSPAPRSCENAPFSIIIALEEKSNHTPIIFPDHQIRLWQGDMLIMRGDCFHAGAAYLKNNKRLFIATGTKDFLNLGRDVNLLLPAIGETTQDYENIDRDVQPTKRH